jgi:hypothetical protein
MTKNTRTALLGVTLVAVAGVVITDRASNGADSDAASDAQSRYLQEASLVTDMQAALAQKDEWSSALAESTDAFANSADRLLVAESEDIAFVRLRDFVQATMSDLGLSDGAASALPARTPLAGEPLRVVGLRLEFQTNDPSLAYRLVDRLENLAQVRANVESINIVGPGRLGRPRATVTLDLRALAWIGRGT